jgi:hypothetical protein
VDSESLILDSRDVIGVRDGIPIEYMTSSTYTLDFMIIAPNARIMNEGSGALESTYT